MYDDGLRLHVKFPARADWPAVFVRNPDGTDSLVNFTVEQDELIVHKVAERFILRRGKLVGCLINRAFDAVRRSQRESHRVAAGAAAIGGSDAMSWRKSRESVAR